MYTYLLRYYLSRKIDCTHDVLTISSALNDNYITRIPAGSFSGVSSLSNLFVFYNYAVLAMVGLNE